MRNFTNATYLFLWIKSCGIVSSIIISQVCKRSNCYPSNPENFFCFEDIIGKTDVEIFTGAGVKESQEFKKEVLERGLPAKREITFETELFGSKTFLIYVEPVFSKAGDTIGVNYMGMDVTDQLDQQQWFPKEQGSLVFVSIMDFNESGKHN
ncbi:Histidine kinase 5 [Vitis vinifera]|uniref:Histidine kinase 5 n=1 Tax=Vitis vinifera TaxID=29760 RepID=A0A438HID9_VITVI|nr:Histidine kinase 5 [Vitis vinifera]